MQSLKSFLLLLALFIGFELSAQCPMGNITLTTQTQVDNFSTTYPGCTAVLGDLYISGADITNLNGLSGLTSVAGNLGIEDNDMLLNVDGLSGITSVAGDLYIGANDQFTNINGLSGLTSVTGNLTIESNDMLTNVDGLSGLTSVGEDLYILFNNLLTNLDGLSGLTSVGGDLLISSNSLLDEVSDFCGLYTLISATLPDGLVGSYDVSGNGANPAQQQILDLGAACPVNIAPIPTMGQWGLILLSLMALIFGAVGIRKSVLAI